MAEIINLRQARKKKKRAEKEQRAGNNRVAFGRTKAEKALSQTEKAREEARHGGGKLRPDAES